MADYFHGVSVEELVDGALLVQTSGSAILGIVGTSRLGEKDKLYLLNSPTDAQKAFGSLDDIRAEIDKKEAALAKLLLEREGVKRRAASTTDLDKQIAAAEAEIAGMEDDLKNPYKYTLEKALTAIYLQSSPQIVAMTIGNPGSAQSKKAFTLKDPADKEVTLTVDGTAYTVIASELFTQWNLKIDNDNLGMTYEVEVWVDATQKQKVSIKPADRKELKALPKAFADALNALKFGEIVLNATVSGSSIDINPTGEVVIEQVAKPEYQPVEVNPNVRSVYTVLESKINAAAKGYTARATETQIQVIGFKSAVSSPDLDDAPVRGDASINVQELARSIAGSESGGTGLYRFYKAKAELGYAPAVLLTPNFEHIDEVQAALQKVQTRMRATSLIGPGPGATFDDSVELSDKFSTSRFYAWHDWVEGVGDIGAISVTPYIAGLIAQADAEIGFWATPSNRTINGIKRLLSPMGWSDDDKLSEVNLLNKRGINCVIREGGFRAWGSRTLGKIQKSDAKHKFYRTRRTTDAINKATTKEQFGLVDEGVTKGFVSLVLESQQKFLDSLKTKGAIVQGKAYILKTDNSAEGLEDGQIVFTQKYAPTPTAEQIQWKSILTNEGLQEVIE